LAGEDGEGKEKDNGGEEENWPRGCEAGYEGTAEMIVIVTLLTFWSLA
jgi:hypothetical protein